MAKQFTIWGLLGVFQIFSVISLPVPQALAADEGKTEETLSAFDDPDYVGPKILINAAARKLRLYDGKELVKEYPIAVGTPGHRTPIGERTMKMITWNPWWLPPDSPWAKNAKDTPPGPNNPLGPVKMDLGEAILVHGTNKPGSVGHAASHGCMRMKNEQAKELARLIQERYTAKTDPALFDQYQKNNRSSYYVRLETPIPVKIIYDTVEISDGQIQVYTDIYGKAGKAEDVIKADLTTAGYKIDDLNVELLKDALKNGKRKDFTIAISPLFDENLRVASGTEQASAALAGIQ